MPMLKHDFAASCYVAVVLTILANTGIAAVRQPGISIELILQQVSFGSRFPLETELVRKYGDGEVHKPHKEETWHTYYVAKQRLWVRCKVEANRTKLQPLTEILVTSVPLGPKASAIVPLGRLVLKNVRVGDESKQTLRQWGSPLRTERAKLGSIETTAYLYRASNETAGPLITLYVRSKTVVGFSLSDLE